MSFIRERSVNNALVGNIPFHPQLHYRLGAYSAGLLFFGFQLLHELPKDSNVPGPGQAQNNFNANADVSKELNLLHQAE